MSFDPLWHSTLQPIHPYDMFWPESGGMQIAGRGACVFRVSVQLVTRLRSHVSAAVVTSAEGSSFAKGRLPLVSCPTQNPASQHTQGRPTNPHLQWVSHARAIPAKAMLAVFLPLQNLNPEHFLAVCLSSCAEGGSVKKGWHIPSWVTPPAIQMSTENH